jgi:hypothetical protein
MRRESQPQTPRYRQLQRLVYFDHPLYKTPIDESDEMSISR